MPSANLGFCCICGKLLDIITDAVIYKKQVYCFEHYDELMEEEQDKEYNNEEE